MTTDGTTDPTEPGGTDPESESSSEDPNSLVGTILAERYEIEVVLGQGGMGTVYRAEHIHMRKAVALKVLHPEIAALGELAARFEREAIAAGRIEHPNVAKAMDFGRLPDGSFYLVIEYVKGKCLTDLIAEGPLAPVRALDIARQIADAIAAAHEAGVVHRDLKPDNVMLAEREDNGDLVKVLDFGVAKLESDTSSGGSPITRYGAIVGTPEYMAPEQAGGGAVDHRADLYALGVIFYEMLAATPPFSADDRAGVLTKHLTETPPPLPGSIPAKTTAIVFDLLAKEPDTRIQSAAVLIDRIDEARAEIEAGAIAAQADPATIGGTTTDGRRATRKRPPWLAPALAAGAALILIALTGGVIAIAMAGKKPTVGDARIETPTAEPSALAPVTTDSEPVVAPEVSAAPSAVSAPPEASSADETTEAAPAASGSPESASKTTTKSGKKGAPKQKPQPKGKRKTGPFGIYVPPISEW